MRTGNKAEQANEEQSFVATLINPLNWWNVVYRPLANMNSKNRFKSCWKVIFFHLFLHISTNKTFNESFRAFNVEKKKKRKKEMLLRDFWKVHKQYRRLITLESATYFIIN